MSRARCCEEASILMEGSSWHVFYRELGRVRKTRAKMMVTPLSYSYSYPSLLFFSFIQTSTMSMLWVASRRWVAPGMALIRRGVLFEKLPLQSNTMATLALPPPPMPTMASSPWTIMGNLLSWSTWFIKRTYQPSIIRKRRKHGFLQRNKTVGGRKVLNRRKHKGRARLGGC